MSASNVFGQGFGIRKLEPLVKAFPDILAKTPAIGEIKKVDGYSDKTATAFLEGLPKFREFLATNAFLQVAESQQTVITKTKLAGLTVVLTGFRSQDLEGRIVEAGGKVGSSISSNTSILVAKDVGETSSKIKKAMEYGVHIMSIDGFIREFL
jgi:NAD-dependent DNA ligase